MPERHRGTFAGLAHPAVIEHLVRLGITAIELLPIHAFVDDRHLVDGQLDNYWGYNTLSFFAPAERYMPPGGDISQLKLMVHRLHEGGIEVLLDVVYSHTAEGNHLGPTLSFRGIDNASYYMLADAPRFYFDTTGCGSTVNLEHPRVPQMVMDSLRYWVEEIHVDGFRFDLATALARQQHAFRPTANFLAAIRQDPSRRSSSSPSRGISAREATWSGISHQGGLNGTAVTAMICGATGRAIRAYFRNSPRDCSARPTSSTIKDGGPGPASTSSLHTMDSR